MTDEAFLRGALSALEVNDTFTEAVIGMTDGSRLCLRHRVGERRAWAEAAGLAGEVLSRIVRFRLNAKHIDIQLQDGGRWEAIFPGGASRYRGNSL